MKYKMIMGLWALVASLLLNQEAGANNIVVTNVALHNHNAGGQYVEVGFNISWDNSWRTTDGNWDAAWVFVKVRPVGSNWQHATLSANSGEHTPAAGSAISAVSDGKGVFIYRSAPGTGAVSYAYTKLRWNYGTDGYSFAQGESVAISVHAIEMVYVPQGAFYLGSTGTETAHFYKPDGTAQTTNAYVVASEDEITVGTSPGNLYYSATGGNYGDGLGPISNAFPKGYAAFYCMKYEISQGQYASFLNKLTATQDGNRFPNQNGNYRHTITGTTTNRTTTTPDRACNYLSWADGAAYADWAGLRPMTELEFEKACRGPALPFANEYAWGDTTISATTGLTGDGMPQETANNGNCNYSSCSPDGPYRCGIYATASSTRQQAGASYYGIMEMSGNLWERPVTVGNLTGRKFKGTHGNGVLTAAGDADVPDWPGTGATGAGLRGGSWYDSSAIPGVSARFGAAVTYAVRDNALGFRCVRVFP